jgi:glyoxylase-like metal-dependent hydrolase (beta-lactamase superfamily II)
MKIEIFTVGPFAENTYLLIKDGKAVLIDPGFSNQAEFRAFKEKLASSGAELLGILLTHAHIDHVLGLKRVLNEYSVPVYMNHSDLQVWNNLPNQAAMFGFTLQDFDFTPDPLPDEGNVELAPFQFETLYTPGHSPDHVSIYFKTEHVLIAGDVLFRESIGRTDLYRGDFELLASSIREKLYPLPDDTVVYPGHGPETTIGHEKKSNPFVPAK